MRPVMAIGIVLLVLGIAMLAYQGISFTQQEHVAQVGPVHVTKEEKKTIPFPPILGAAAVGVGAILVFAGLRKA